MPLAKNTPADRRPPGFWSGCSLFEPTIHVIQTIKVLQALVAGNVVPCSTAFLRLVPRGAGQAARPHIAPRAGVPRLTVAHVATTWCRCFDNPGKISIHKNCQLKVARDSRVPVFKSITPKITGSLGPKTCRKRKSNNVYMIFAN